MNIYNKLMKFLQSQDQYRIDINRLNAESEPRNIQNILESFKVYLIPKNRQQKRKKTSSADITAEEKSFNNYIDQIEKWIEKNAGLQPSHKQRYELQRDSVIYPELVYREDLPDTKITVKYINSQGQNKNLELKGKNRLEVRILGLFPN